MFAEKIKKEYGIRTEIVDPSEFLKLKKEKKILGSKFILPKIGSKSFGDFKITKKVEYIEVINES